MGIYGASSSIYDKFTYGEQAKLSYSVLPFTAVAVDYDSVEVGWSTPTGTISAIRLVRNQYNYPENPEDGVVLFESSDKSAYSVVSDGPSKILQTVVGLNKPLKSGQFVYYTMFIKKSDANWYPAGSTYCLVPSQHNSILHWKAANKNGNTAPTILLNTHDKFMDLLPRVFSSDNLNSLDEYSKTSDLYNFLKGFSFTADEFMTYSDLLLPNHSESSLSPNLVLLKTHQYGLNPELGIGMSAQKKLVREGIYLSSRKGTLNGVGAYIESLTGFSPTMTISNNLLLSLQDSTFYTGVNFWTSSASGTTLSATTTQPVDTTVFTAGSVIINRSYTGLATIGTANDYVYNGEINQSPTYPAIKDVTKSIPVTAGTVYNFSLSHKRGTGTGTITPSIRWYDSTGTLMKTDTGSAITTTSGWTRSSAFASGVTAPGATFNITAASRVSNVVTLTTSSTHSFTTADTITISGTGLMAETQPITAAVISGSNVTYTSANHQFAVNEYVTITGVSPSQFNLTNVKITAIGTGTFTVVASPAITGAYTSGGTATSTSTFFSYDGVYQSSDVLSGTTGTTIKLNSAGVNSVNTLAYGASANNAYATFAAVRLAFSGTGTYYLHALQFADNATTTYSEARSINIALAPDKINYLPDPSFTNTNSKWTVAGATPTWNATGGYLNDNYLSIATTSATNSVTSYTTSITPGKFYSFSVYMKSSSSAPVTLTISAIKDSDSSVIATKTSSAASLTSTWSRQYVNLLVPASSDALHLTATVSTTNGQNVQFDGAQVEASYLPSDYLDGAIGLVGASWTGTANDSSSILYYNKDLKISRLLATIADYLPINTAYSVTSGLTGSTLEGSGIS